jgi:membrane protease YdiL (CAAX protease family)
MRLQAAVAPFRRADLWGVLLGMILPTLVTWLYFVALARHSPGAQQTAYAVGKTLQFAFPLLWVFGVRRQPIRFRRPGMSGVAAGLLFGAAIFAAILLAYHAWLGPAGLLVPAGKAMAAKVAGFGVASPAAFAGMAVFYAMLHSFLEEYYWRWFLFGRLRSMTTPAAAAVLSSLAFTSHHVLVLAAYFGWRSPETAVLSLGVAVGGMVWAWIYHRSGSLLGPWLSHALADAALFTVGYGVIRPALGW